MKRFVLVLVLAAGALGAWLTLRKSTPPETPFAKVTRETIVSTLNPNGTVEPLEYAIVRAEREGAVWRVAVEKGQHVAKGALILEMEARDARADLVAAQARMSEARAEIARLDAGGRPTDLAEIESGLAAARLTLKLAQEEYLRTQRLFDKKAATREELEDAREKVDRAQLQIESLERRRGALVVAQDKSVAQSKLREAEAAAELAQRRIDLSVVRSPIDGVVYQFDIKPGTYLHPGDQVASAGRLDKVKVTLYVDEPDLGRVEPKIPVTITWDALPGRKWTGAVNKTPTQVVARGTRQVGEVECVIANPDLELLPGTNVNGEIRAAAASATLTIPKEVLHREGADNIVYRLSGDRIEFRKVTLGIFSVTKAQVVSGLNEGDSVALPVERAVKNGERVTPVTP